VDSQLREVKNGQNPHILPGKSYKGKNRKFIYEISCVLIGRRDRNEVIFRLGMKWRTYSDQNETRTVNT
jgi:hypothetical protein